MIERSANAHMIAPADRTEPIESTDNAEPIEPMDNTEPTDPIESTEPLLPMQSTESWDLIDHVEPSPRVIAPSWCTGTREVRPTTRGMSPTCRLWTWPDTPDSGTSGDGHAPRSAATTCPGGGLI